MPRFESTHEPIIHAEDQWLVTMLLQTFDLITFNSNGDLVVKLGPTITAVRPMV